MSSGDSHNKANPAGERLVLSIRKVLHVWQGRVGDCNRQVHGRMPRSEGTSLRKEAYRRGQNVIFAAAAATAAARVVCSML